MLLNMFKLSSVFADSSKPVIRLWIIFAIYVSCYICYVVVVALWSPPGRGWLRLSCVLCFLVFLYLFHTIFGVRYGIDCISS